MDLSFHLTPDINKFKKETQDVKPNEQDSSFEFDEEEYEKLIKSGELIEHQPVPNSEMTNQGVFRIRPRKRRIILLKAYFDSAYYRNTSHHTWHANV